MHIMLLFLLKLGFSKQSVRKLNVFSALKSILGLVNIWYSLTDELRKVYLT